jgi:hypothetical protein
MGRTQARSPRTASLVERVNIGIYLGEPCAHNCA